MSKQCEYEETCFKTYSLRLEQELEDVILRKIIEVIRAQKGNNASVLGLWIALGAQFDSRDPSKRGFAVAAWHFPTDDFYGEFAGLLKQQARTLKGRLEGGLGKRRHSYDERFATDNLLRIDDRIDDVRQACCNSESTTLSGGPRDYAVAFGLPTITACHLSRKHPKARCDDSGRVAFFDETGRCFLGINVARALDQPALKALRHFAAAMPEGEEYALMLILLPVRQENERTENRTEAVVGLILQVPVDLPGAIGLSPASAALSVPFSTDASTQLFRTQELLRGCQGEVAGNPIILAAITAMREAYRRHHDNIYRLIDNADRKAMKSGKFAGDVTVLQPLLTRLAELATNGSPVQFALDGACEEILAAMRGLVHSIGWDRLMSPVLRFAVQERLLLGVGERRDHYIHTLKVFLLGREILDRLGCYDEFFRPRWILAAIFHDVCYPLQKAEEWAGETIKSFFKNGVSFKLDSLPLIQNWKGRGYEVCPLDMFLRIVDHRLANWLETPHQKLPFRTSPEGRRFQTVVAHQLIEKNHAVLSAFSLLLQGSEQYPQHMPLYSLEDAAKLVSTKGREGLRQSELLDASTAILLHDSKLWSALLPTQFSLRAIRKAKNPKQEDCVNVLAWTLAVADVLQEWGRDAWLDAAGVDSSTDLTPILTNWKFKAESEQIHVTLEYGPGFERMAFALADAVAKLVGKALVPLTQAFGKELMRPVETPSSENLLKVEDPPFKWRDKDRTRSHGDPRGRGDGLDYVPKMTKTTEHSATLYLSVLAAMHDLLGDDCPVGGEDWRHAVLGLGMATKRDVEKPSDELVQFGRDLREHVRRDKDFKKHGKLLKRFHGFQRIPRAAMHFWGASSVGPHVERVIKGKKPGSKRSKLVIDVLPAS